MIHICLTSMLLLIFFIGFSSSAAIGWCASVTFQDEILTLGSQTWCCQAHEICGEVAGQCEVRSGMRWFTYLIIVLSIIMLGVCFGRPMLICLGYRTGNPSMNISQSTYQPIVTTNIQIGEESPPSYEQIMKNDNLF